MSAQQLLLEAANKNAELLRGLNETESASSSLEQSQAYLDDLDREINVCNTEIQHLEQKTVAEHKDHKKYADSITRRFIVRKSQHFAEKASKEQREYFEAVAAENQAKSRLGEWMKKRDESRKQHATLENTNKTHQRLQSELDALYNSIFAGPTPDFPGEDQKESAMREAKEAYKIAKLQHEAGIQVAICLEDAERSMREALERLGDARDYSQDEKYSSGMMLADVLERNALMKAKNAIEKAKMLLEQAQRLAPNAPGLGNIEISQGHVMSDIMMDDIKAQHARIMASRTQVDKEARSLWWACIKARERSDQLGQKAAVALTRLETARRELQRIRGEAFESFERPPPTYDREASESFEGPPPTYDEAVQHSLAESRDLNPVNT
ncbi:MAG: hypothetical protein L6R36_008257 [Xanthoria steineri]|nr:MAG: hypothetical protein L6R36_008257 [Xanthoria steineri]